MSKHIMTSMFVNMGMSVLYDMECARDEWKERIIKDWQKTFDMPRKMKKARRKELLRDWSIACYDPFGASDLLRRL